MFPEETWLFDESGFVSHERSHQLAQRFGFVVRTGCQICFKRCKAMHPKTFIQGSSNTSPPARAPLLPKFGNDFGRKAGHLLVQPNEQICRVWKTPKFWCAYLEVTVASWPEPLCPLHLRGTSRGMLRRSSAVLGPLGRRTNDSPREKSQFDSARRLR